MIRCRVNLFCLAGWLSLAMMLSGCANPAVRSQSPESADSVATRVELIGDIAVPHGTDPVRIEAVGLVTGLDGTGDDPEDSAQRSLLLDEMKARDVHHPNSVLASPMTALVLVRGYLRPGIQKGDRFDVEVRIPVRSKTTSLRGGWLMESRMRQMAVFNAQIRKGSTWALAEGPVMIDPSATEDSPQAQAGRGRVLGGGVAVESRQLGLVLKPDHQSIPNSARIGAALNRRFHTYRRGIKEGVANPQTDRFVELAIHPRYKDNVARYMQVARSIPLRESPSEREMNLKLLKHQLLDPVTASSAALRLEAIGEESVDVLAAGLASDDVEVRFYAAESLAYLDDSRAAKPLADIARDEPAFRVFALTALSAMDAFEAYESLRDLLSVPSAETRYGAFRALWAMNPNDRLVRGEELDSRFNLHVLNTSGPSMIHVTRSYRPELVMFGSDQRLMTPLVLDAGPKILVKSTGDDKLSISRYSVGEPDQKKEVGTDIEAVIRAIVDLGGTYPDVVQFLQQAKQSRCLQSRLEVEALPQAGRLYTRTDDGEPTEEPASQQGTIVTNPLPDLFPKLRDNERSNQDDAARAPVVQSVKAEKRGNPFQRLVGRFSRDDVN